MYDMCVASTFKSSCFRYHRCVLALCRCEHIHVLVNPQAKEDEMRSAVLVEKQRREQYQRMALRVQFNASFYV